MHTSRLYLFKRGSRYYVQFRDQDGRNRQVSTGCTTKTAALLFVKDNEAHYGVRTTLKLLSSFIKEFEEYGRGVYSKSTFRSYISSLENLLKVTGDIKLPDINTRIADQFKSARRQSVSASSVNVDLRSLKSLFTLARKWGYVPSNPFLEVSLLRCARQEPKFLSVEIFTELYDSIKEPWLKNVVRFAALTGMRISEITNLRWEDVHIDRRVILVTSSIHFTTKNKRNRILPISQAVNEILLEVGRERTSDYVFHNHTEKLNATYTSKRFRKYVKKMGIEGGFVFHNLRSTFASWMIMNGVDIFIVSKLLGHSDVSITAKFYANIHNEYLFKSINTLKMNKFLVQNNSQ